MGLKHLNGEEAENFGYIGEKEYWGKTIGVQRMEYLIEAGRFLELESIYSVKLKTKLSINVILLKIGW
ncbi:MAG: hypothetical protein ITF98_10340 [Fermentimonas sp.]|nr:hypothetical protein [Fermentimonas sp.]